MNRPELTDMAWLGPKDEMDRASHRIGKCSECHEIICVEKAVTDGPSTQGKTSEMLYEAFRAPEAEALLGLQAIRYSLSSRQSFQYVYDSPQSQLDAPFEA